MNKKTSEIKQILTLAYENHRKGNLKLAESLYKKILKIDENNFDSIFLLGSLLSQKKNFVEAIKFLEKAIKVNPNHANSYQNLGYVSLELEEYEKAKQLLNKAIELEPKHIDAHFNLGNVYKQLRNYQKAQTYYEKTIFIQPNNAKAHNNLANVFKQLGQFQNAIKSYKKAIQIQPNHFRAYHNLGNTYNQIGEFESAADSFKKAFSYHPANLESLYNLSELKKEILDRTLKKKIIDTIKSDYTSKKDEAYGNFLLAKFELMDENLDGEFTYLLKGHQNYYDYKLRAFQRGVKYWLDDLPEIKELEHVNENTIDNEIKPIFIIGVPRCGSTLVEKVITSGNKKIPIGEESNVINHFVGERVLAKKSLSSNIEELKDQINAKYKELGLVKKENNYIFTDKTLDNFFFIGIIKKIFPSAKVINCQRNPLSSIISILKNNLGDIPWAHNLEHIFKYFDIYYNKINFFNKKYPNYIYDLDFESFQNNPEEESKKVMQFCDLPWDKKCLEFYKRKDLVSYTASNRQIRQAIYKTSLSKHHPYKKLLKEYGKAYNWFK